MLATYRLTKNDLTEGFLDALRQTFGSREMVITVEDVPDETEYLLTSETNRNDLLAAVEAEKRGEFHRTMTIAQAEALAK
jgi:hypothetical protein